MNLLDELKQLSQEIRWGEIEAEHLKHLGLKEDEVEVRNDVAYLRREHRTLILKGYYETTGSVVPDVGESDVTKAIRKRMKVYRTREDAA